MSSMEMDGFLSEEAEESRRQIQIVYKAAFEAAQQTNSLLMRELRELHIDWNDESKTIVASLFVRSVETYQALIILLERGMVAQGRMLVRTLLETLFAMAAIAKNPQLKDAYIAKHYDSTIKAINSAKRWKQPNLKGRLEPDKIEELIEHNKAKLAESNGRILKINQWAEEAGLSDYYNLFYVENSSAVHSDMLALNDHVVDGGSDGAQVYFGPSDFGLYHALRTGATAILTAVEALRHAYPSAPGEDIMQLRNIWESHDDNFYGGIEGTE
ncbi:hypothetical protein NH8B_1867 [Pseudogulbenkiania sp. NH8B]|uniref:DUF5677 domain-containing protein n=1 Tax=Pseudogulbenkiania sp. (strain NH8B) TaxID=748280 RepID=UPI0002279EEC|nr:DUF5677 domain-containing protein [Pseudogulbenkiania sp. NH8B]BAK76683.1 hypothetical protein NH8B_1867 [Pseudogulbenkiania sp. NH8B]